MSKCIASAPLSQVERIATVFGNGRSMAQVKAVAAVAVPQVIRPP